MNTVLQESTLSPSAAARLVGRWTGRPTPAETIVRWHKQGLRSSGGAQVRLEMVRVGGRLVTSSEALSRFFDALETGLDARESLQQPGVRARAADRAKVKLRAAGF